MLECPIDVGFLIPSMSSDGFFQVLLKKSRRHLGFTHGFESFARLSTAHVGAISSNRGDRFGKSEIPIFMRRPSNFKNADNSNSDLALSLTHLARPRRMTSNTNDSRWRFRNGYPRWGRNCNDSCKWLTQSLRSHWHKACHSAGSSSIVAMVCSSVSSVERRGLTNEFGASNMFSFYSMTHIATSSIIMPVQLLENTGARCSYL